MTLDFEMRYICADRWQRCAFLETEEGTRRVELRDFLENEVGGENYLERNCQRN